MFTKTRERIAELEKTNQDFRDAKTHFEKHKTAYTAVGGGIVTLALLKVIGKPQTEMITIINERMPAAAQLLDGSDILIHDSFIEKLKEAGGVMNVEFPAMDVVLDVSLVGYPN